MGSTIRRDFEAMGLTEDQIGRSLNYMGEATVEAEVDDQEVSDDAYLSDLPDEEDLQTEEDDEDLDLDLDLDEDDELSEEERLEDEMLERVVRLKRGTAKQRSKAKRYYKTHKAQISRAMSRLRKKPAYKKRQARLQKMSKGGSRTRRVLSHVDDPGKGNSSFAEGILGELQVLAEAVDQEPRTRFDEFVDAFNQIADIGELIAMDISEDDSDVAGEFVGMSLKAEGILKHMETLDGALSEEEDAELEETLADAMEEVGALFDKHEIVFESDEEDSGDEDEEDPEEDLEEDEEDEGNPFSGMADALREARPPKQKGRKLANYAKPKTVKGASKWGKMNPSGASRRQLAGRKDVRNVEAMLGYLKKVKSGKVAPGQAIAYSKKGKPLSRTARAAKKMAGKKTA